MSGLATAPNYAESSFDEAGVTAAAEKATGLHDWGADQTWRPGLRAFLSAIDEMGAPPQLREQARGRAIHLLSTRLHFVDEAKRFPEITAAKIERPLIVIGLPRTGTTILYDLLARDPVARTPKDWEYAMPWPAPEIATYKTDPRIAIVESEMQKLLAAAPELAKIQRFSADLPSECNFCFTHHFASTNLWAEMGVPSYIRWLIKQHIPERYKTHKRVLQELQWKGPRGRWTLKSPEHLFELEGLLDAYPDACLVWTHRDPLYAFSSGASMIAAFWKAAGVPVDPKAMGQMIHDIWSEAISRAMKARKDPRIDKAIIDIAHADVVRDPVAAVRRIYDHFQLPFTDEYRAVIERFVRDERGGDRFGKHKHTPAEYGLTAERVREALPGYYERFAEILAKPYPKQTA